MATKQKHKKQKRHGIVEPTKWRALINMINANEDIDNPKNPTQLAFSLSLSLSAPAKRADNLIIDGVRDFEALQELLLTQTQDNLRAQKRERDAFLQTQMAAELIQEQKRQQLAMAQSQNHVPPAALSHQTSAEKLTALTTRAAVLGKEIATLQKQISVLQTQVKQASAKVTAAQAAITQTYANKKTNRINILSGKTPYIGPNGQQKTGPVVINNAQGKPIDGATAIAVIKSIPEPPPIPQVFKINPDMEQRLTRSDDREENLLTFALKTNLFHELLAATRLCNMGSGEGLTMIEEERGPDVSAKPKDIKGFIICNEEYCYVEKQTNNENLENELGALKEFINSYILADDKQNELEQKQKTLTAKQAEQLDVLSEKAEQEARLTPSYRRE